MNRLILRFLNSPILLLLSALAVAIQTSLFANWPLRFFEPNILLLVVLWCALKRDFVEGGIITLIISDVAELHSAVPQGVFLISYMAFYLCLRLADKLFVLPTELPMVKLTLTGTFAWHTCSMILISLMSHRALWEEMLVHVVPSAVMTTIFGIWVYRALDKFDLATFKTMNAENPDEFQIENLGI